MITASPLSKAFGPVAAVIDVSLYIQPGEIYDLVGSDGAGKTTTLRLLIGALKADTGRVNICGYDVVDATERPFTGRISLPALLTLRRSIRT